MTTVHANNEVLKASPKDIDMLPYAAHLALHVLGVDEIAPARQKVLVGNIASSGLCYVEEVDLTHDDALPRLYFNARLFADGDLEAVRRFNLAVVTAMADVGHHPEDLEFVEEHLGYVPAMEEDGGAIEDKHYTVEEIDMPELDGFGELVRTPARVIFADVCDQVAQRL